MASRQAGQDGADGKLFSGVRFVLAGFDEPSELEFLTELERNGGQNMGRYSASCTHVIVCDLALDEPICVAALKDGKELVTEYWVADCLQFGTLMDTDTVLYRPLKDLNGIPGSEKLVLCLTGYQGQMRTDIMRMVDMMGARFTKPLLAAEVTHLICYKFEGGKFDLANKLNIKLVNHRWLEDCLLAWKVLPETGYQKSGFELEFGNVVANDSEENGTPESTFRTASKTPGPNDATTTTPKTNKQGAREKTPRSCPSTKSRRMVSPGSRIQMLQSSRKGKQLNFQSSHTPMREQSVAEHQTTPTAHSTPMQPSSSKGQALVSGIVTGETCSVRHDENKTPQVHRFEVCEQASGAMDGAQEPRDGGAVLGMNGGSKTDEAEKVLLQVNETRLSSFNAQTVSTVSTAIKMDEADCQNEAAEQRPDRGKASNCDVTGKVVVNNHIQELKEGNGDRCSRVVENTSLQGALRSPGTGKCEMGADGDQQGSRTVQTATSTRDTPSAPFAGSELLEVNVGVGPTSAEKSDVLKAEMRTFKAQAVGETRKEPGEDELRQKSPAAGLIHSESNTQMIEETALAVLKSFGKSGISKGGDSPDDMEILQESRQLNQIIASTSMLSAGKRKLSDTSLPVSNADDLSRDQLAAQETKNPVRRDLTSEPQADLQGDENTPSPWRTKKAKLDPVFASPVPGVLEANSVLDSSKLQKSSAKPKYAGLIRKLLGSESVKRPTDFYDLGKEFCDDFGQGVTTPATKRAHRSLASGVQSVNKEEVPQEALPGQGHAKQPPIPGKAGLQSALKKKADQATATVTPLKRPFDSLAKTQSNRASPAGVTKTPKLVGVQKKRDTKTVNRPVLQTNAHGDPETKADSSELPKFPQLLAGVQSDVEDKTTHQTVEVLAGEDSQLSSGPNEWTHLFAGNPPSNPLVKDADIPAAKDQDMSKINQCGLVENVTQGGREASKERLQSSIDRLGEAQIETTVTLKDKVRQMKQKATTRRSKGAEAVQLGLEAPMPAAVCETGRGSRQSRMNKEPVKDVPEVVIEDDDSEERLQSSIDRLGEAQVATTITPKVKVRQKKQKVMTRKSKEAEAEQLGIDAPMPAAVCETGKSSRQPRMNKEPVKGVPEAVIEDDHSEERLQSSIDRLGEAQVATTITPKVKVRQKKQKVMTRKSKEVEAEQLGIDAPMPAAVCETGKSSRQPHMNKEPVKGVPEAVIEDDHSEERLQSSIDRLGEAQIETTVTPKVKARQKKEKATTRRSKKVEAVQLGLEAPMPAAVCEIGRSTRQPRTNKESVKDVPEAVIEDDHSEEKLQSSIDRLGEAQVVTTVTPKVKVRQKNQKATTRRSKGVKAVQLGLEASMPAAVCETGRSSRQPRMNKDSVKDVPEAVIEDDHSVPAPEENVAEPKCSKKDTERWFALAGRTKEKDRFKSILKKLGGKLSKDGHKWHDRSTHVILPALCRTEKFFAGAAAGRWLLKADYLEASMEAKTFVEELDYEWHGAGYNGEGNIGLDAPRKWRKHREETGCGAFHSLRIVVYGECTAPTVDTLKRAIEAGGGRLLATAPPYGPDLSGIDFALLNRSISAEDKWVKAFVDSGIACVAVDYLIDYVCKPSASLEKHILHGTSRAVADARKLLESNIAAAAKRYQAGQVPGSGTREQEVKEQELKHPPSEVHQGEEVSEEGDDIFCSVCKKGDREDVMMLCGDDKGRGCGVAMHIYCCKPPLSEVPEEDWFCNKCLKPPRKTRRVNK